MRLENMILGQLRIGERQMTSEALSTGEKPAFCRRHSVWEDTVDTDGRQMNVFEKYVGNSCSDYL